MGPIVFAAFAGTLLLGLLAVLIVKIYEKLKTKEHEIVEHHKHSKE